jgi:hypothetical protein
MSDSTHYRLFQLVPKVEDLLALDLPNLAFDVLRCLVTLRTDDLHLKNLNLRGEFTDGYPGSSKNDVEMAVSSAWSWLMGRGYLAQQPGANDASWVMVTPHGKRWHDEELAKDAKVGGVAADLHDTAVESKEDALSLKSLGFEDYSGIPLAEEALQFFRRAVSGPLQDQPGITFIAILAGFLYIDGPLSVWFRGYISRAGVDVISLTSMAESVQDQRRTSHPSSASTSSTGESNTHSRPFWSAGARRLVQGASTLAGRTSVTGGPVMLRHVMGAFIYLDLEHDDQLRGLGFEKEHWSNAFCGWLGLNYRSELDVWVILHQDTFARGPNVVIPDYEVPVTSTVASQYESLGSPQRATSNTSTQNTAGPSTHVAKDKWTIDDALGYFPYAYAISRFLTDPKTEAPLAISIQAPWGGGKTSLMRMIQFQLDPQNPSLVDDADAPIAASQSRGVKNWLARWMGKASVDQQEHATLKDINDVMDGKRQPLKPIDVGAQKNKITVWFNAWKYESTSQIWAGLADAIVKQVSDRMTPVRRELFFFRLNVKRLNIANIRSKLFYGLLLRFFSSLTQGFWFYLIAPALAYFYQLLIHGSHAWEMARHWGFLGGAADLGLLVIHFGVTKIKFDKSPAELTFGEFVAAPDYDTNIGFIHKVTEDLRTTLGLIGADSRPLVIFIDDLDRCSPNKVSDVVEAINLFLAGEFEHCMFVLGIDDEIVAAALSKAHSEVYAQMPSYSKAASIGWRFMDKFVQLPFIMPSPNSMEAEKYMDSLLTESADGKVGMVTMQKIAESVENSPNKSVDAIVNQVNQELRLSDAQRSGLQKDAETVKKMNADIAEFSDENRNIAETIKQGLKHFSRNPREMKRFVNSFRFYYFLRSARISRGEQVPSLDQLSRWIHLSLKWPGLVRWVRSLGSVAFDSSENGLLRLVGVAHESGSPLQWSGLAGHEMGLNTTEGTWLNDDDLFHFFKREDALESEERLSQSFGGGLW